MLLTTRIDIDVVAAFVPAAVAETQLTRGPVVVRGREMRFSLGRPAARLPRVRTLPRPPVLHEPVVPVPTPVSKRPYACPVPDLEPVVIVLSVLSNVVNAREHAAVGGGGRRLTRVERSILQS